MNSDIETLHLFNLTSTTERRPQNGEYYGQAKVRVVPPGYSGEDAEAIKRSANRARAWAANRRNKERAAALSGLCPRCCKAKPMKGKAWCAECKRKQRKYWFR